MRARFPSIALFASLLPVLASGCWMEEFEQSQAEPEPELPSQPLPLEESPTAFGMLRVVNELGFVALDHEVGLDRQAAASILAHRAGPDARSGTADDRFVADLAELDELYWLGEDNLWRIQAYALLEGRVPEEVADGCDPALAEALAGCRAFMMQSVMGSSDAAAVEAASWRCVEASDDAEASAAGYFAAAGLVGRLDPALGYHGMLCGDASASASSTATATICELGVAGIAAHGLPECVAEAG
jgi:hypothetical protein